MRTKSLFVMSLLMLAHVELHGGGVLSMCSDRVFHIEHGDIHEAAIEGCVRCLEKQLRAKPDAVHTAHTGEYLSHATPLHLAARQGQVPCIKMLLEYKAAVDGEDDERWTPLHYAAKNGKTACVKMLIEHKATVDSRAHHDYTPLHWVARQGHTACIPLLIQHKASVLSRTDADDTPLHLAAWDGHAACIKELTIFGGDLTGNNANKINPEDLISRPKEKKAYHAALAAGRKEREAVCAAYKKVITEALNGPEGIKEFVDLIVSYGELAEVVYATRLAARKQTVTKSLVGSVDIKDLIAIIASYDELV